MAGDPRRIQPEDSIQKTTRVAFAVGRHGFGRPLGDHATSTCSPLGSHVDHPVGRLDHVQMVLDHHQGVAAFAQLEEHLQQPVHVLEVQPRRGFIQQVQHPTRLPPRQLGRQFQALRLASGQRRGRLSQPDVTQPNFRQRPARVVELRNRPEERHRLVHR